MHLYGKSIKFNVQKKGENQIYEKAENQIYRKKPGIKYIERRRNSNIQKESEMQLDKKA